MDGLLSPADIERMAAEAGITVPELCRRAGIAHTTFYRWKRDETQPTLRIYERIRKALREAVV